MTYPRAFLSLLMTVPLGTTVAFGFEGCSGAPMTVPSMSHPVGSVVRGAKARNNTSPIQHIVIMIQENRSFDNLFATFSGADGASSGMNHKGKIIPLKKRGLAALDINHTYPTYMQDYDGGKMDGFDLSQMGAGQLAGMYPYQYVDPTQIQPYWTLATAYVLADHMFQTQGSGSFTAHQDLVAGGTVIDSTDSIIDTPSSSKHWGCDANKTTVTSLLTTGGQYLFGQGPFPCLSYSTLRDLLDAHGVSWKYYTPPHRGSTVGALWNAFDAIPAVRYGPEWTTNVSIPETNIFGDITSGQLPALSWVIPSQVDSDHPQSMHSQYDGPSWVASVVNAIGTSTYWNSTAIVIVWDDWGGFYDHEPPAFFDNAGGLGFRVPMIVVSPYVTPGQVTHTQYEFGSILKFVEESFSLGSLGTTDVRATSIGALFNPSHLPLHFKTISAKRSRAYFLHRPPSYEPVDTQ